MEWGEKSESDTQSVCNLFVEFFQNTYFINWSDHTNIVEQRPWNVASTENADLSQFKIMYLWRSIKRNDQAKNK